MSSLLHILAEHVMCVLQYGRTPLHLAAYNNHPQVVEYLLDNHVEIDCMDSVSIQWCYTMCHTNVHVIN